MIAKKKRRSRETYFICSSIIENKIKNLKIKAFSEEEALYLYYKKFAKKAETIEGPFYKKIKKDPKPNLEFVKFSNIVKKALYHDLKVNAFLLDYPNNYAYLVPCQSENKIKKNIVSINELKFIEE